MLVVMMKINAQSNEEKALFEVCGSFCSPLHGRQTQCLIRSLKSHGNYFPRVFVVVNPFRFRHIKPFDFEFSGLVHFLHKQDLLRDGSGTLTQGSKTDEFSEKSRGAFSIQKNYVVDSGNTWLFEHEIDTKESFQYVFSTIVLRKIRMVSISGNHVHAFHTIWPSYLLAYI